MILLGDALNVLKTLPDEFVQTCVTSPPYWGLRDYGVSGQIGIEKSPQDFVENLRLVFREVNRILKEDGTLWLNLGDSYCGRGNNRGSRPDTLGYKQATNRGAVGQAAKYGVHTFRSDTIKAKDLVGIPWRVAFALQEDGWYLRQDIIWHKPNPMPESVKDRCTKAHEYFFLLSKSATYYFDSESIQEPAREESAKRYEYPFGGAKTDTLNTDHKNGIGRTRFKGMRRPNGDGRDGSGPTRHGDDIPTSQTRNKRSVWTVATNPYRGAHFATFPPDLIEPCILAGSRPGDTVLDPFAGAGTTWLVSEKYNRNFIGIELNPEYAALASNRIVGTQKELNL